MKKFAVLCAALLLALVVFAGCAPDGDSSGSNVVPNGTTAPTSEGSAETTDPVLTPIDMEGYVFEVATEFTELWNQPPGNSPHGDAVMDRIHKIEEDYNCTIKYVPVSPVDLGSQIKTKAMASTKSYDLIGVNMWGMGSLLSEKYLEPMNNLEGLHLNASYWVKAVTDVGTFGGKTYFNMPVFSNPGAGSYVMYFNDDLRQELNLENPWDYVEKGEWTWDKFAEMGMAAAKDLDSDNKITVDDRAGAAVLDPYGDFAYNAYLATVGKIIEKDGDTVKLSMDSERSVRTYNVLGNMMRVQNFMSFRTDADQQKVRNQFQYDNAALFFMDVAGFAKPFGRDSDFDFGVLPLPSLEVGDKNYCPLNHNTHVFGLPVKNPNLNKAAVIYNALASQYEGEIAASIGEFVDNEWIKDERSFNFYKNLNDYVLVDQACILYDQPFETFGAGARGALSGLAEGTEFISKYETTHSAADTQLKDVWAKIVS